MTKRWGIRLGVLALLAVGLPRATGAPLPSEVVGCGETVVASFRLAAPLDNCPADGLIIGTDGITVDLGGHRISGATVSAGIKINGFDGVTILNGVIDRFRTGVELTGADDNTIKSVVASRNNVGFSVAAGSDRNLLKKNTATRSPTAGISISSSQDNVVVGNIVTSGVPGAEDQPANGIQLSALPETVCAGNKVKGNRVVGNGGTGIALNSCSANRVRANVVTDNGLVGIAITGSADNRVKENDVRGSATSGISLSSSSNNVVALNKTGGNSANGISVNTISANNTISSNIASGNDDDGINVGSGPGNVISRNKATANGRHGIRVDDPSNTVKRNKGVGNGFFDGVDDITGLGIFAAEGITGGNNVAKNNDDPDQCEPATICVAP